MQKNLFNAVLLVFNGIYGIIKVMNDRFYTPKEVAAFLKVNVRTITRMINAGILEATKVGIGDGKRSVWRISDGDFLRYQAEQKNKRSQ